jgi:hypothetical protein
MIGRAIREWRDFGSLEKRIVQPQKFNVRRSLLIRHECAAGARGCALPISANHGERMRSASATERALASFMTSDGTQIGKRSSLDWWFPLALCSSHTLASCSSRNREPSLTNAGHRRRCTYVILPSTSLQTRTLGLSQIAFVARRISFPFGWPHQLPRMGPPTIDSARFGRGPRAAWRTTP